MTENLITIGLIAAALILAGCSVTQGKDTALVAANVVALQSAYTEAEAVYDAHIDDVPADQRERVERAWRSIETLHSRIDGANPRALLNDAGQATELYELARDAYTELRPVVERLVAEGVIADAERVARLREIDRRAQRLDEAVERLRSSASPTQVELLRTARDVVPLVALVVRVLV